MLRGKTIFSFLHKTFRRSNARWIKSNAIMPLENKRGKRQVSFYKSVGKILAVIHIGWLVASNGSRWQVLVSPERRNILGAITHRIYRSTAVRRGAVRHEMRSWNVLQVNAVSKRPCREIRSTAGRGPEMWYAKARNARVTRNCATLAACRASSPRAKPSSSTAENSSISIGVRLSGRTNVRVFAPGSFVLL